MPANDASAIPPREPLLQGDFHGVLGLWTIEHRPAARVNGVVAFGIAESADAGSDTLVWRINLPADVRRANAQLRSRETQLRATDIGLRQSEVRIKALVQSQIAGPAFAIGIPEAILPQPEADLLRTLNSVGNTPHHSGDMAAFGLIDDLSNARQKATDAVQTLVDQLVHAVANYAWVETQIDDKLLGRTIVSWLGSVNTVWGQPLGGAQAALHERALSLALRSRDRLIQAFATVTRGAMMLATLPALLASPAGVLLALPAAWKFVNQVLTQLDSS